MEAAKQPQKSGLTDRHQPYQVDARPCVATGPGASVVDSCAGDGAFEGAAEDSWKSASAPLTSLSTRSRLQRLRTEGLGALADRSWALRWLDRPVPGTKWGTESRRSGSAPALQPHMGELGLECRHVTFMELEALASWERPVQEAAPEDTS